MDDEDGETPAGGGEEKTMVVLLRAEEFAQQHEASKTFYVGFLQAKNDTWFPFCVASSPDKPRLDTLCVSTRYACLDELMKPYVERLSSVKNSMIHLVYEEEIENLLASYGIEYIGYVEDGGDSCGCGCGCH